MGRKLLNRENKYPQPIKEEGNKVIKLRFVPQPKSFAQEMYLESLRNSPLTIGSGPAGSGKSFLAMAVAMERLLAGDVQKVVLTRPAVEAGQSLGFLPGDLDSKIAPYLKPLLDATEELVGPTMAKKLLDAGKIEFAPLSFMRGRTLRNCLPADHLVLLSNNEWVRMDDLLTRFSNGEKLSVVSFNIETRQLEDKTISFAFKQPNEHKKLVKITLENGETIFATPDHKLYTQRGYVAMSELTTADQLTKLQGELVQSATIKSIEYIDSEDDVFDITVEDNHNFFTNGGILSSNCYVILDEAQNATPAEMKLFVTRAGDYSTFVVNGDPSQCDLNFYKLDIEEHGLDWIMRKVRGKSRLINIVEFGNSDIQRSELVRELLIHLDSPDPKTKK